MNQTPLPDGWRMVRLVDVATFDQGGTPPKGKAEYWDGDIPFLTGADLIDFRIGRDHARSFLTESGFRSGSTLECQPGDILLATRTAVGLAALATEVMGVSQDITRVTVEGDADPEYICRQLGLLAPQMRVMARGTTIQGITRHDVESLPIFFAPPEEQRTIAEALASIEKATEDARNNVRALESLMQSATQELLTGKVRVRGK